MSSGSNFMSDNNASGFTSNIANDPMISQFVGMDLSDNTWSPTTTYSGFTSSLYTFNNPMDSENWPGVPTTFDEQLTDGVNFMSNYNAAGFTPNISTDPTTSSFNNIDNTNQSWNPTTGYTLYV